MLRENERFKLMVESLPKVGQQIVQLWRGSEASAYVNQLLQDTRGGTRQGFPPDVAAALFKLMQKHDGEFPQHALMVGDIWADVKTL